MELYNLRDRSQKLTFSEAVLRGGASHGGLFFPVKLPKLEQVDALLSLDFLPRSVHICQSLVGDEFSIGEIEEMVTSSLTFPAPVVQIEEHIRCLELFHGPTLAFKDFGARFMAQVLSTILSKRTRQQRVTILTATSGDTGAAVAHAFYRVPNIDVAVLYPSKRISVLQEKLFCTLGGNIRTFEVDGNFDDCQRLVKACFDDPSLVSTLGLTSANSINVSRLFAQTFYYFEGVAQSERSDLVVCVPSGNFGNLTAGLMARAMGLPVKAFVAATNDNDIVPSFLRTGKYETRDSVATLSNAMDVGAPNNWQRVVALYQGDEARLRSDLRAGSLSDDATRQAMRDVLAKGYLCDPHSAVAYRVLSDQLKSGEEGLFLSTAHPAKFKDVVQEITGKVMDLPEPLAAVEHKAILSEKLDNSLESLKRLLLSPKY